LSNKISVPVEVHFLCWLKTLLKFITFKAEEDKIRFVNFLNNGVLSDVFSPGRAWHLKSFLAQRIKMPPFFGTKTSGFQYGTLLNQKNFAAQ
jgi:hypothetical protein